MIEILIIKGLLIAFSILTLGLLPFVALLNLWIWNEIIIVHVISFGKPITSYWIMLGLTGVGFGFGGLVAPLSKIIKLFK